MATERISPIYKCTAVTPENRNTPHSQDDKNMRKPKNPSEPFENFLKRETEVRKK